MVKLQGDVTTWIASAQSVQGLASPFESPLSLGLVYVRAGPVRASLAIDGHQQHASFARTRGQHRPRHVYCYPIVADENRNLAFHSINGVVGHRSVLTTENGPTTPDCSATALHRRRTREECGIHSCG